MTVFIAEIIIFVFFDRIDELIDKLLTLDIKNTFGRLPRHDKITDGMHQMRFTEPGAAIQKQWIKIAAGRFFGNSDAGCVGKAIAAADYE